MSWSPAYEPLISSVVPCFHFHQWSLTPASDQTTIMVRTRGGSRLRPRVRFSTPKREEQALVPAPDPALVPTPVPEAVPKEPQGFRRYQTRMGPRAPSLVPQRRSRRAQSPQAGPHIRPGRVILIQTSAVSSHLSRRGDIFAPVVARLQDQEAVICREPHPGECKATSQRVSSGVVL